MDFDVSFNEKDYVEGIKCAEVIMTAIIVSQS